MIVLNGERFIKHNIRSVYPYAYQIIIVEGASYNSRHNATLDGHSTDNTLKCIEELIEHEDHENKISLITAEDEGYKNGFWPGEKDEQSQAYAKRTTGNWLWQLDVDEFYHEKDLIEITAYLTKHNPSMVFFYLRNFWYRPDIEIIGVNPEYNQSQPIPRIFRWGKEYKYVTHRPPTVIDSNGNSLKLKQPLYAEETKKKGWYIWHYPFLFKHQFESKARYYDAMKFRPKMSVWAHLAMDQKFSNKFNIGWDGMHFAKVNIKINYPSAIDEIFQYNDKYPYLIYLFSTNYRVKSWFLYKYICLIQFFRVKVFRKWWTYYPYMYENVGPRSRVIKNSLLMVIKDKIRNSAIYQLLHFLGLIGWRAF